MAIDWGSIIICTFLYLKKNVLLWHGLCLFLFEVGYDTYMYDEVGFDILFNEVGFHTCLYDEVGYDTCLYDEVIYDTCL